MLVKIAPGKIILIDVAYPIAHPGMAMNITKIKIVAVPWVEAGFAWRVAYDDLPGLFPGRFDYGCRDIFFRGEFEFLKGVSTKITPDHP